MLKKLRIKFVIINMTLVTAMLIVIFGMVMYFTKQNLEQESLRMMQEIALDPLQTEAPPESRGDIRMPYFVVQFSQRGELMITGSGYYDLSDTDFLLRLITESLERGRESGVIEPYNLRYYRTTVHSMQCLVFADVSSEIRTMRRMTEVSLLLGGVSLLAFFAISLLLARWAVKPVARAWTQQRQFVADASHELKTPLTVIMTNAELLQSPDYDETARAGFSANILTMSRQMRGLVEGMLELARVDNGAVRASFARLDFSKLLSDAVLPFEPLCFEQGLRIETAIEPDVFVNGSASHLRQVAEILLDNAQKYTAPRGTVLVTLQRNGHHCLFSVADPGEAISQEDLKNIFKRFYRIDPARSMNHSYGLGLSIAAEIVKEHHGRIWAESAGGINTFFVQLPAADGGAPV